ncbi:hypothetical protein ES705_12982 [subsurface metagenome]
MTPRDENAGRRDLAELLDVHKAASRRHGPPKEVVSIRLDVLERLAVRQLAEVMGFSRSGVLADIAVLTMRRVMLEDPDWPMHPVWACSGKDGGAVLLFNLWAWAITSEDPAVYLQKVRLDGVTGYRPKPGCPAPNILDGWDEQIDAHQARLAEKAECESWCRRRGDKHAKPVKKPRPAKKASAGKRLAAKKRPK